METKGKRVRRTAMLLLWSAICAAGGTAVGHGIAPTVLAVSYTHLDVYKRQP